MKWAMELKEQLKIICRGFRGLDYRFGVMLLIESLMAFEQEQVMEKQYLRPTVNENYFVLTAQKIRWGTLYVISVYHSSITETRGK